MIRSRLYHVRLDRELAAGAEPAADPLRLDRARTLTRRRFRGHLAASLERVIEDAEQPRFSPAIPVRAAAVRECAPMLLSLALALREPTPVNAEGVARALILVTDGASPLYWGDAEQDLGTAVRLALEGLYLDSSRSDVRRN